MEKSFTLFLLAGILFGASAFASGNPDDSATQVLKAKMEQMEKHIQQLQSTIKTLQQTDSSYAAELKALKQSTTATKEKKLVIDRRGGKQALFQ
ncbi:MAG: hypothetical protein V4450_08940 [Bacteroidota bacterium]